MAKTPNLMDRQIGKRLRFRRVELGLTQQKLGEALGVSFQQVQKYEKGSNRIGASRVQQIARILDVPPSYFYDGMTRAPQPGGLGEPDQSAYFEDLLDTRDGLVLIRAFSRIHSSVLRKKIIDLVNAIALIAARQAGTDDDEKS